jgi:sulfur dioxygenase
MFRQLFDTESSTLTYLIVDDATREAVLLDPVLGNIETYIALLKELNAKLKYSIETHVHADHITASGMLRERLKIKTAVSEQCSPTIADIELNDGDVLTFGNQKITVIATPGHTPGSSCFLWGDRLFTGDTVLINGCGRTDFQNGNSTSLYESITKKVFTLPDETLIYPGHDYNGRRVSSVAQEKLINPRIAGKTQAEFVTIMDNLNLPKHKMMDVNVPANRMCGVPEENAVHG